MYIQTGRISIVRNARRLPFGMRHAIFGPVLLIAMPLCACSDFGSASIRGEESPLVIVRTQVKPTDGWNFETAFQPRSSGQYRAKLLMQPSKKFEESVDEYVLTGSFRVLANDGALILQGEFDDVITRAPTVSWRTLS